MKRSLGAALICAFLASSVFAQIIVDENFDGYANISAYETAWKPDSGNGQSPTAGGFSIITPSTFTLPSPYDTEPASGQAIIFDNSAGVNELDNGTIDASNPVVPTSTKTVRLSTDIFDDGGTCDDSNPDVAVLCNSGSSGRRFTVGMRNDSVDTDPSPASASYGLNLIELGHYNADTFDPTNPDNVDPATRVNDVPATGYGFRVQLFGAVGGDLAMNPNWQYFDLDPSLDVDGDGLVKPIDIGAGWHRYSVEVSTTGLKFELDLFRDGTVDATKEYTIAMANDPDSGSPAGFTSLRMGGPSGISRNNLAMVDNVMIELVDAATGVDGDFDDNAVYNCADVDLLSQAVVAATNDAQFDLTGDGLVNIDDLNAWLSEAGNVNLGAGLSYPLGDANLDGVTDVSDFSLYNANRFQTTGKWCSADFNLDGATDVSDFAIWNAAKFGQTPVSAVPEPATISLLCLGMLTLGGRVRRKHA